MVVVVVFAIAAVVLPTVIQLIYIAEHIFAGGVPPHTSLPSSYDYYSLVRRKKVTNLTHGQRRQPVPVAHT